MLSQFWEMLSYFRGDERSTVSVVTESKPVIREKPLKGDDKKIPIRDTKTEMSDELLDVPGKSVATSNQEVLPLQSVHNVKPATATQTHSNDDVCSLRAELEAIIKNTVTELTVLRAFSKKLDKFNSEIEIKDGNYTSYYHPTHKIHDEFTRYLGTITAKARNEPKASRKKRMQAVSVDKKQRSQPTTVPEKHSNIPSKTMSFRGIDHITPIIGVDEQVTIQGSAYYTDANPQQSNKGTLRRRSKTHGKNLEMPKGKPKGKKKTSAKNTRSTATGKADKRNKVENPNARVDKEARQSVKTRKGKWRLKKSTTTPAKVDEKTKGISPNITKCSNQAAPEKTTVALVQKTKGPSLESKRGDKQNHRQESKLNLRQSPILSELYDILKPGINAIDKNAQITTSLRGGVLEAAIDTVKGCKDLPTHIYVEYKANCSLSGFSEKSQQFNDGLPEHCREAYDHHYQRGQTVWADVNIGNYSLCTIVLALQQDKSLQPVSSSSAITQVQVNAKRESLMPAAQFHRELTYNFNLDTLITSEKSSINIAMANIKSNRYHLLAADFHPGDMRNIDALHFFRLLRIALQSKSHNNISSPTLTYVGALLFSRKFIEQFISYLQKMPSEYNKLLLECRFICLVLDSHLRICKRHITIREAEQLFMEQDARQAPAMQSMPRASFNQNLIRPRIRRNPHRGRPYLSHSNSVQHPPVDYRPIVPGVHSRQAHANTMPSLQPPYRIYSSHQNSQGVTQPAHLMPPRMRVMQPQPMRVMSPQVMRPMPPQPIMPLQAMRVVSHLHAGHPFQRPHNKQMPGYPGQHVGHQNSARSGSRVVYYGNGGFQTPPPLPAHVQRPNQRQRQMRRI